MENKKYELINKDGSLFDSIEATSFKKAREYFKNNFEGNYIILCEGQRKNVRL